MSRLLRGVRSRGGLLATLAAMTALVVAGTTGVVALAGGSAVAWGDAAPVLLLGAVAVTGVGREVATERRREVGIARLRGVRGLRLAGVLLAEPALAVVVGAVVGLALGLGPVAWLARSLAPRSDGGTAVDDPAVLGSAAVSAAAIAVISLGLVAAAGAALLREGVGAQVGGGRRVRPGSTGALLGACVVLVGAAAAVSRAGAGPSGPDLVVLLGPALVGLAAAEVAVRVARAGADRLRGGDVGRLLARRRIARGPGLAVPVRLAVAAGVVAAVGLSAVLSVTTWSRDQALVQAPGDAVVPLVDLGAVQALALTHRLDPEGEHLMAGVLVPGRDDLSGRRGFIDVARWEAVAGETVDGTPAALGSEEVSALPVPTPDWAVVADELVVEAELLDEDVAPGRYQLDVVVIDDADTRTVLPVTLRLVPRRPTRVRLPVESCAVGCQVVGLVVTPVVPDGAAGVTDVRDLRLATLRLGGLDLLAAPWVPGESARPPRTLDGPRLERVPDDRALIRSGRSGLEVVLVPGGSTEVDLDVDDPVPVLTAGGAATGDFGAVGGDERATTTLGTRPALPLVGSAGVLADLRAGAWASGPTVPEAETFAVVGEGTPSAVLDELRRVAGAGPASLDERVRQVRDGAAGSRVVGYGLVMLICLGLAVLALAAGSARQVSPYRREVAALRSVGLPHGVVAAAARAELLAVGGVVAIAVTVGGWVTTTWVLPGLQLVEPPPGGLAFTPSGSVVQTMGGPLVMALVVTVAVLVVVGRARRTRPGLTRPANLREDRS